MFDKPTKSTIVGFLVQVYAERHETIPDAGECINRIVEFILSFFVVDSTSCLVVRICQCRSTMHLGQSNKKVERSGLIGWR